MLPVARSRRRRWPCTGRRCPGTAPGAAPRSGHASGWPPWRAPGQLPDLAAASAGPVVIEVPVGQRGLDHHGGNLLTAAGFQLRDERAQAECVVHVLHVGGYCLSAGEVQRSVRTSTARPRAPRVIGVEQAQEPSHMPPQVGPTASGEVATERSPLVGVGGLPKARVGRGMQRQPGQATLRARAPPSACNDGTLTSTRERDGCCSKTAGPGAVRRGGGRRLRGLRALVRGADHGLAVRRSLPGLPGGRARLVAPPAPWRPAGDD